MALTGWVATHTGMPSLIIDTQAGVPWSVSASSGGTSWTLSGAGTGGTVLVSDPRAPLGRDTVYRAGAQSVTLRRQGILGHALTDLQGRTVAPVAVTGDDSTEHASGVSTLLASSGVADRWPLSPRPDSVQLDALTSGDATTAVRSLAVRRSPVIVLHHVGACDVPGCDISAVRVCVVESANERRTKRVDRAVREWSLSLSDRTRVGLARGPYGGSRGGFTAPVVTWGEWAALGTGWQHLTYRQVCQRVAGAPA